MNFLQTILRFYIPASVKRQKLRELFALTADAFRCEVPPTERMSYKEILEKYAVFTRDEVEKAITQGKDIEAIKQRLFQNAVYLGESLRKSFHITDLRSVMTTSRILYRILGIEFCGCPDGEVFIERCFFSSYYSRETCEIMSSLDEGVAAGLSGGMKLEFVERITEGKDCCKAHLKIEEDTF